MRYGEIGLTNSLETKVRRDRAYETLADKAR